MTNPNLQLGDGGEWVVYLQDALSRAGHFDGNASGSFDDHTEAAVKEFQSSKVLRIGALQKYERHTQR